MRRNMAKVNTRAPNYEKLALDTHLCCSKISGKLEVVDRKEYLVIN